MKRSLLETLINTKLMLSDACINDNAEMQKMARKQVNTQNKISIREARRVAEWALELQDLTVILSNRLEFENDQRVEISLSKENFQSFVPNGEVGELVLKLSSLEIVEINNNVKIKGFVKDFLLIFDIDKIIKGIRGKDSNG